MERAGPLIGMPFSLEGFAFFLEAIALGIYLYGWDRVSPRMHLASGVVVALSGLTSGVFVVAVNAWMNTPRGFRLTDSGQVTDVDLWQAFFTPAFPTQATHMALAAYSSVGFAVLGIHAYQSPPCAWAPSFIARPSGWCCPSCWLLRRFRSSAVIFGQAHRQASACEARGGGSTVSDRAGRPALGWRHSGSGA